MNHFQRQKYERHGRRIKVLELERGALLKATKGLDRRTKQYRNGRERIALLRDYIKWLKQSRLHLEMG